MDSKPARPAGREGAMISLASEYTDAKGRKAQGWLFYDAECRFCTRLAHWVAPVLAKRGMALAPLQDPRVAALLGLARAELLREMRSASHQGTVAGGAKALVAIARQIWWAAPVVWTAKLPGGMRLLDRAYHWLAAQRQCTARACSPGVSGRAASSSPC